MQIFCKSSIEQLEQRKVFDQLFAFSVTHTPFHLTPTHSLYFILYFLCLLLSLFLSLCLPIGSCQQQPRTRTKGSKQKQNKIMANGSNADLLRTSALLVLLFGTFTISFLTFWRSVALVFVVWMASGGWRFIRLAIQTGPRDAT